MTIERKYIWWHHGQAFAVAGVCTAVGFSGAGAVLVLTRGSPVGTLVAAVFLLGLLPLPFVADRRIARRRRALHVR